MAHSGVAQGNTKGLVTKLPSGGCVSHIIYPHLLFAFLAEHYSREFELYMAAESAGLSVFWRNFLTTDYGARLRSRHVVLRDLDITDLAWCIPLVLHGDAAPYSKKRSALFVQWGALLG